MASSGGRSASPGQSRDRSAAKQDRPGGSRERRGILETFLFDPGSRKAEARRARMVDLCAPWLSAIATLRTAGQTPAAPELRARVLELKARFESEAREAGFQARDIEAAVFGLVAFTDESVLNTPGAAREAWQSRPLQLELFGQNVAGEEFFTRLQEYRSHREDRIEALEVYYCCLAFGFAGKLRLAGAERLRTLLGEVERDMAAVRGGSRRALAPHAARHDELADVVAEGVPLWLSAAIFIPAALLTYLFVKLLAHHGAAQAARAIGDLLPR